MRSARVVSSVIRTTLGREGMAGAGGGEAAAFALPASKMTHANPILAIPSSGIPIKSASLHRRAPIFALTVDAMVAYASRPILLYVTGFIVTVIGADLATGDLQMKLKPFVIALSVALIAVCLATPGLGQTTFGTLLGSVTDASGAVVPNATIKVTNQGENTSRDVRSDANGNYQAENMKEGIYTLTVKAPGFSELTVKDVRLTARQTVRTDLKLAVGGGSEKVTVEALPELINTESQAISASVTSTEVLGLPANYRGAGSTSPYNLLAFLPGVTGDNDGNISVQGTGTNQVQYTMDGIETSSMPICRPSKGDVPFGGEHFRNEGARRGGGAEYGGAADITTTSKSGTNAFHGSAFEYFQNAALDATRFTVPQVVKPAKSANTFGGSLGGPIFKNHTFFFGDYEGMRYRTQTVRQETVPNQAMRNGEICRYRDPLTLSTIFDPNDGTPLWLIRSPVYPFRGRPTLSPRVRSIQSHRDSPVLSAANPGGPNNFANFNHTLNVPNPILSDQFDIRIDHTINTKQNVFGRWTYKNGRTVNPSGLLLPAEADFEHDNQIVLAHNYAITPNLINELRGGLSRGQHGGNFPLDGPAFMQQLGLNPQQLGPFPPGGFPDFVFEPRGGIDAIVHTRPDPQLSRNFQINENLTWTKGKHSMKFGFDMRKLHLVTAWYSGSSAGGRLRRLFL